MRYPRCQKVLVVLQEQAELVEIESLANNGVRVAVRQQVVQEIAAGELVPYTPIEPSNRAGSQPASSSACHAH